jgi:hypothetical protein
MLKPFGWWFGSGFFADDWAFEQLLEVYRICGSVDPDFQVLERLAKKSTDYPGQCLSAFASMIRSEADRWTYWGHLNESRKVLEAGLANEATRPQAEALIHEIGARGDMQFRELLSTGDDAPPPPVGD